VVFLARPEIAGGEALAGVLRPGNAGSNTAADHITVLGWALESRRPTGRARTILVRNRNGVAFRSPAALPVEFAPA
jgi:hypothetical protein